MSFQSDVPMPNNLGEGFFLTEHTLEEARDSGDKIIIINDADND